MDPNELREAKFIIRYAATDDFDYAVAVLKKRQRGVLINGEFRENWKTGTELLQ